MAQDAMRAPGFTAEASLAGRRSIVPSRPSPDPSERGVRPAQSNLLGLRGGPRYVVEDSACPPGQRLVFVQGSKKEKLCEVRRLVYDLARMQWVWGTTRVRCGWEFVAPHWECQLPTFTVAG
jgi:hypothetical protein